MPSADVFQRWQRYEESNTEELKKLTRNFYNVDSGIGYAI